MIWRSTTELLCSDHRCEQEWNKTRLKHTFRPVPAFDGFRFSVRSEERPCCRLHRFRVPRGWMRSTRPAPHPQAASPSGGHRGAALNGHPLPAQGRDWRRRAPCRCWGVQLWPGGTGRGRGARDGLSPLNPWRPRPPAWRILASASLHTRTHPQGRVQGGRADPHAPPCPHSRRHLPAAAQWPLPQPRAGALQQGPEDSSLARSPAAALNWTHQPAHTSNQRFPPPTTALANLSWESSVFLESQMI